MGPLMAFSFGGPSRLHGDPACGVQRHTDTGSMTAVCGQNHSRQYLGESQNSRRYKSTKHADGAVRDFAPAESQQLGWQSRKRASAPITWPRQLRENLRGEPHETSYAHPICTNRVRENTDSHSPGTPRVPWHQKASAAGAPHDAAQRRAAAGSPQTFAPRARDKPQLLYQATGSGVSLKAYQATGSGSSGSSDSGTRESHIGSTTSK